MRTVTLAEPEIRCLMKKGKGLKREQAIILGVKWPLKEGWMEDLFGKQISELTWHELARLRDKPTSAKRHQKGVDRINPKTLKKKVLRGKIGGICASFDEWNAVGYMVKKGERSRIRAKDGTPLFKADQVYKVK